MSLTATTLDKVNTCPICGKEGIQKAVELLPKHGTLMQIRHPDGKLHRWVGYDSIYDVGTPLKSTIRDPRFVNCPNCHKRGRVNHFYSDRRRPETISYVIVHEKIEGTWGEQKMQKRRRCYIKEKEHRDYILKRLGRFIR